MPGGAKLRKQLLKMWNENPHCHWCGKLTTIDGRKENKQTAETATLDHLYSRLDPRRREVNRTMEKRRLLACYECNQRRCREEMNAVRAERERRRILSALGIQTIFE
jgi:hypothetical protein